MTIISMERGGDNMSSAMERFGFAMEDEERTLILPSCKYFAYLQESMQCLLHKRREHIFELLYN